MLFAALPAFKDGLVKTMLTEIGRPPVLLYDFDEPVWICISTVLALAKSESGVWYGIG
jgi:hypothetical protein